MSRGSLEFVPDAILNGAFHVRAQRRLSSHFEYLKIAQGAD